MIEYASFKYKGCTYELMLVDSKQVGFVPDDDFPEPHAGLSELTHYVMREGIVECPGDDGIWRIAKGAA